MQSDLTGRVRNTKLAARHALLPLFEAIANAVDAIGDAGQVGGTVDITITREGSLLSGQTDDSNLIPEIADFSITDNGVGFTAANFESFGTLDSLSKQASGGKGVGRLLWLVAFDHATIDSRYTEGQCAWHRQFQFRRTAGGVEEPTITKVESSISRGRTTVRLVGFHAKYRDAAPKSAKAIAKRIIEHFLVLYMLEAMPDVVIHDTASDAPIRLSQLFTDEFTRTSSQRTFAVSGIGFTITDVLLRASSEADNAIHYCANRRVVKSQKLSGLLAHTDRPFTVDGEEVLYAACITSPFLDGRVDAQRTEFDLDSEGELGLSGEAVRWDDIAEASRTAVQEFLIPHLQEARDRSVARIREYVDSEEPRYRILLNHRPEVVASLPGNLSDDRLELELHKALQDWRHDAKAEATRQLKGIRQTPDSFAEYKDRIVKALGDLQEVAKADLADYVVHRRAVLDFFEQLLGMKEDGKFSREDALHSLFFPMRKTSDQVDYEEHNLWLLDEELAFHHYLASDLPFNTQDASPIAVDNAKRPDLLIYNRKMVFAAEDQRPFSSVVLVEFKRPELDDYTDTKNPVIQAYDYIRELREGKAKNRDGSTIDRLGTALPFFCNVVVTLSTRLREQLENMGFTQGPDEQSYFVYNKNLNAYVDVSSYGRVLQTAVRRNKAFFAKIGLHSSGRRL